MRVDYYVVPPNTARVEVCASDFYLRAHSRRPDVMNSSLANLLQLLMVVTISHLRWLIVTTMVNSNNYWCTSSCYQ